MLQRLSLRRDKSVWLMLPLMLFTGMAQAQAPTAVTIAPASLDYVSAFANYTAYADQELAPWRAVNDTVTRIGGWRAYARQARQPNAASAPASPKTPSGGVHDAHQRQSGDKR